MAKIKADGSKTKKDAIIKEAAGLFRKKGFASSSMRELAEMIGVEASSLYNHIGSKSEILQSICFKVAADFNFHLHGVEKSQEEILSKLEMVMRFHINMMVNSYDEIFVANHEWKNLEEPYLKDFLDQRKIYEAAFARMIRRGIKNGEIKSIHPHVATLTILSAVRGLEFWHRNKSNVSAGTLENDMITHLLKGLIK